VGVNNNQRTGVRGPQGPVSEPNSSVIRNLHFSKGVDPDHTAVTVNGEEQNYKYLLTEAYRYIDDQKAELGEYDPQKGYQLTFASEQAANDFQYYLQKHMPKEQYDHLKFQKGNPRATRSTEAFNFLESSQERTNLEYKANHEEVDDDTFKARYEQLTTLYNETYREYGLTPPRQPEVIRDDNTITTVMTFALPQDAEVMDQFVQNCQQQGIKLQLPDDYRNIPTDVELKSVLTEIKANIQ